MMIMAKETNPRKERRRERSREQRRTIDPLSGLNTQLVSALLILLCLYTVVTFSSLSNVPILEVASDRFPGWNSKFNHNQQENDHNSVTVFDEEMKEKQEKVIMDDHDETIDFERIKSYRKQFPIMIENNDDSMEEILHPGKLYSNQKEEYKMKVPKFWTEIVDNQEIYGKKGVREYLGHHGKRLMTLEEAKSIGSFYFLNENKRLETIYVSVASYRDPECGPTIESIFARAKYPERIRVAIVDQHDFVQDKSDGYCLPPEPCKDNKEADESAYCRYRNQVDVLPIDAKLSVGPVFARHLSHRMYRGEYYAMQVDSHVQFIKDWDDDIIWQWKSAKNELAVLTTYLSDLVGSIDPVTHESKHPGRPIMCVSDYEGNGKLKHLRHGQQPEGPAGIHGQPTLHPFWAAGFSFGRGHFVVQVPYDQYLPMVFQGEEISMGLRGFTYGYDYYAAERSVCFHMYAVKENKEKRQKVKLFWENQRLYRGAELEAMKRLNGIIGMANNKNEKFDHTDESKYGLGEVRNTSKFFTTFGIHTDKQMVEKHLCSFVGKPMMKEFQPHLRPDTMGIDYDQISYVFVDPQKK